MDDTLTVESTGRSHNYPMSTCPHCGRDVPGNMVDLHASICAKHPDTQARTLAALVSDTPGVGKTMKQYEVTYRPFRGLSVTTLLRQYAPTWAGVLDAFGLATPPDARKRRAPRTPNQQRMTAKQREDAVIAATDAERAVAQAVLEAERTRQYGIEVASVRDYPNVTIGGRRCVALMLR